MRDLFADDVERFLDLTAPEPDAVLADMEAYADEVGFPIVGRDVGRFLRLLARTVDARRVFEFGSGFGYSAYWFAEALPADGQLVLTDYDAENADRAGEFLARAGYGDVVEFVVGDALDAFATYEGPFDVVLVDHDKARYTDALSLAREQVPPGGVIVADNMMAGPVTLDDVVAALAGSRSPPDDATRGIVEYVEAVRDDPAFETVFLPLGGGVAVSYKR